MKEIIQYSFELMQLASTLSPFNIYLLYSGLQHLFVYYAAHNGVVLETEHESERSILGHGIVVRYDRRYECRLEPYK